MKKEHTRLDLYWGGAKGGYRPVVEAGRCTSLATRSGEHNAEMNGLKRKHLDFAGKEGLTNLV